MFNKTTRIVLIASVSAITATPAVATTSADIISTLQCNPGELMRVTSEGVEDNYTGGIDPATPRANVASAPNVDLYRANTAPHTLRQFDDGGNDRWFMETMEGIRAGSKTVSKGLVITRFRSTGAQYNTDGFLLGDLKKMGNLDPVTMDPLMTPDLYGVWSTTTMFSNGWTQTGDIFHAKLEDLTTRDGSKTLVDLINDKKWMSLSLQDDSEIDFITFAVCQS